MNITIQQAEISSDGRFIVLKAAIKNEIYTFANIYGPNKDADAVKFYRNLSKLLRNNEFGNGENIIIGGDFTCPLNITLDKKAFYRSHENIEAGHTPLNFSETLI